MENSLAQQLGSRVLQFISAMGVGRKEFTSVTGVEYAIIQRMLDGQDVSTSLLPRLIQCYPLLNPDWLLYGEGTMFKKSTQNQGSLSHRFDHLIGEFDALSDLAGVISDGAKAARFDAVIQWLEKAQSMLVLVEARQLDAQGAMIDYFAIPKPQTP